VGDLFRTGGLVAGRQHDSAATCTQTTPGGKMSTPTGDKASLHELELTVKAELTFAETSQPEEQAGGAPGDEWPLDPDVQRYEVNLRALLGAVEALEDAPGPGGDHPPPAEMAEDVMTAGHLPEEPGPGISQASAQPAGQSNEWRRPASWCDGMSRW
jgi:hypothetical protein